MIGKQRGQQIQKCLHRDGCPGMVLEKFRELPLLNPLSPGVCTPHQFSPPPPPSDWIFLLHWLLERLGWLFGIREYCSRPRACRLAMVRKMETAGWSRATIRKTKTAQQSRSGNTNQRRRLNSVGWPPDTNAIKVDMNDNRTYNTHGL